MTQHRSLTIERWRAFRPDQQILMIANEMNRARRLQEPRDRARLRSAYERVLRLVDLTVEAAPRRALRRELLRWRDLAARLYALGESDPRGHARALRALLLLSPGSARQIRYLPAHE